MKVLLLLLVMASAPVGAKGPDRDCRLMEDVVVEAVSKSASWSPATDGQWRGLGGVESEASYRCVFHYTAVVGSGRRGVDRLVVLLPDGRYLGSYRVTAPRKVDIVDNVVRIQASGNEVDLVDLSSKEMPDSIFVDGEVVPVTR